MKAKEVILNYQENIKLTRRTFLKGTATLAALAAGGGLLGRGLDILQPAVAAVFQDEWIPTCCNMCGGQTGIFAHIVDGTVVKIEPSNPATGVQYNPIGVHNISTDYETEKLRGGRMCSKGNSGIKSLYDPDRIKTPMRRTNPNKGIDEDPGWVPMTWDEAVNEVATRLNDIKITYGANSLVWFGEDHSLNTHLQSEFCKAYGTPNYHNHANLCDVARKASFKYTMGDERPIPDLSHAKYILLFGWNPMDATKWAHLPAILMDGIEKGAKMVVVDPVFSKTASKAHEWIPIRPATDGALALAMCKRLIDSGKYDSDFLKQWTNSLYLIRKDTGNLLRENDIAGGTSTRYMVYDGTTAVRYTTKTIEDLALLTLDASVTVTLFGGGSVECVTVFKAQKDYLSSTGFTYGATTIYASGQNGTAADSTWAEAVTGISKAKIDVLADEIATVAITNSQPVCIDSWSGPGQQANGTEGGRAIAMLCGLLGQIDKPGTLMNPNRKGSKQRSVNPAWGWPTITAARLDGLGTKYPLAHSSGIYIEAREAMLTGSPPYPYAAHAAVFVMQNFVMSVPNMQKSIDAITMMDFVLVMDTHYSETAQLADILIPGTNYLERYDLNNNWVTFQSLSLRQPVVQSWINGIPEYEFIMRVARAMGLLGFDITSEQYLSDELVAGIGITLDQLKALPSAVWIGAGTSYTKYAVRSAKPAGYTVDNDGIVLSGTSKVGIDIEGEGTNDMYKGFGTTTRRFEFYSQFMKGKSLNPLPVYTQTEDRPTAEYPYYFVSWKPQEHTHTRTQNNVWLVEMVGNNPIWINSQTAENLSIAEGDEVDIISPTGTIRDKVHVTHGIHPEVVAFPRGFGHWALGSVAKNRGAHDGLVISGKAESLSGMARNKEAAVKIIKVVV